MNYLLMEIFFFWFKAASELWPQTCIMVSSDTSCRAYFKYNSKTKGCLQLHCTPNDSSTTKHASFDVRNSKEVTVIVYKLQPHKYIAVLFILCAQVRMTTKFRVPTTAACTIHHTTAFLLRMHLLGVQG